MDVLFKLFQYCVVYIYTQNNINKSWSVYVVHNIKDTVMTSLSMLCSMNSKIHCHSDDIEFILCRCYVDDTKECVNLDIFIKTHAESEKIHACFVSVF